MVCSEVLGGDERTGFSEGIIRIDSGDCAFCFALCRVCLFVRTSSVSFHPHPPRPTVLENSGRLCSRDDFLLLNTERFGSFYPVRVTAYRQLLHLHRTWFCLHPFDAIFTTTSSPAAAWYLPLITFIGASGCTLATAALTLHFLLPSRRTSLHSNMAPHPTNRFALFAEDNENSPPNISQGFNIARIPFENQVADDTIPWKQVKKRSAVEPQQPLPKIKTLVIRDQNRPVSVRRPPSETKLRASSVTATTPTTATGSDKSYDPHENWCGVCNQKFHTKVALQSHMKQTENHQHYCNLCARVFKDRNGLKNHVDNSLGHDVFCNLCLSAFKDQWGLKNHFENNYHVGHEFACLTCLLGFKSHQDMVKHLQTAKKHIWCETCHRPFRNQDERDAHWKKTAGEEKPLQYCAHISPCLQLIQHTSTAWNPAVALMDPMLLHFGRITS
jgi:hypothetical protein